MRLFRWGSACEAASSGVASARYGQIQRQRYVRHRGRDVFRYNSCAKPRAGLSGACECHVADRPCDLCEGGRPSWKLADASDRIGPAALRPRCSRVLDAEGVGLEFIAFAARFPVVCRISHRTQSASIREILHCLQISPARIGSKTYSARVFALSKGDLARGRTKCPLETSISS
jgi:hypothetical protein